MIKAEKVTHTQILTEIAFILGHFRRMICDSRKANHDNELNDDFFQYTPEEWEMITITILHFDHWTSELRKQKTDKEQNEFIIRSELFLAYMRDMCASWYDRLGKMVERSEA